MHFKTKWLKLLALFHYNPLVGIAKIVPHRKVSCVFKNKKKQAWIILVYNKCLTKLLNDFLPFLWYFLFEFLFIHFRWQIWCFRINTTQTGAKLQEGSGNEATIESSSSGMFLFSFFCWQSFVWHACLCLWWNQMCLHVAWCFAKMCVRMSYGLSSPSQGCVQWISVLICSHSVSAPLIRGTG